MSPHILVEINPPSFIFECERASSYSADVLALTALTSSKYLRRLHDVVESTGRSKLSGYHVAQSELAFKGDFRVHGFRERALG